MSSKFNLKKIPCASYAEVPSKIDGAEIEWLTSVLSRINVPKIMINKALSDDAYGKVAWRDYLFETHGLIIIKNVAKNKVVITKIDTDSGGKTVIGEWLKPEVARVSDEEKASYVINLKYWQIVE